LARFLASTGIPPLLLLLVPSDYFVEAVSTKHDEDELFFVAE
jgi:hypothetical protein